VLALLLCCSAALLLCCSAALLLCCSATLLCSLHSAAFFLTTHSSRQHHEDAIALLELLAHYLIITSLKV